MTQEEKQVLIKDLSARLPYGVMVNYKEGEYDFHKWKVETLYAPEYSESGLLIETNSDGWIGYTEYKGCGMSSASRPLHLEKNLPYLRPMSSMTDEEELDFTSKYCSVLGITEKSHTCILSIDEIDWLLAHHFDYRGLIEKGLALEAPVGMYKT